MTNEDAETIDRLARARWSCRAFRPDPVPRETIAAILDTAQHTASWNNVQPWQVIVTSGAATERFRALMTGLFDGDAEMETHIPFPEAYEGVYKERRRDCAYRLYDAVGIERFDKDGRRRQSRRNFELFDAPHAAVVTSEAKLGTYGAVDCGGWLTTFMLAAEARGVATIAQGALAMHSVSIARHFDLPSNRRVLFGLSFGWPDIDDPVNGYRVPRAPLPDAIAWAE